jgi:DNA modification methylase
MIADDLLPLARPIDTLKPLEGNPRKGDVQAVMRSYDRFGQRKPIVALRDGTVIAGNHQLKAARELGWTEIAVVFVEDDEQTAQAFALADNRTADLGTYDNEALADMLKAVSIDPELLSATGYDADDLAELLESIEPLPAMTGDPDAVPDKAPAKTIRGDVWILGNHRLMCGDSTVPTDVDKLMNGARADMAFTDPPYGVAYTGGMQFDNAGNVTTDNREMIANDDIDIYSQVFPVLANYVDGACYVWFAGTKAAKVYAAAEQYGEIHALIIWVKNGGYGALNANYKQKHEPCLYWKPTGKTLNFIGDTTETTVWEITKDGRNDYHPTQKPVALASKAISNHSTKTVLDLFAGSGSTLMAAHQTNRFAYLMELDEHYCDVICKRFQQATGIMPIAEATGNEHNFLED